MRHATVAAAMQDAILARDALLALGHLLGAGDTPMRVMEPLFHPLDAHEVGVALSVGRDEGLGALVYYNPRRRGAGFGRRGRALLARLELASGWWEQVERIVPSTRVSTILGLDVEAAGVAGGTLYLEEIATRLGHDAPRSLASLASALALPLNTAETRVGAPYIWAIDFDGSGPRRLKTYYIADAAAAADVRAEALATCPAARDLLTGDAGEVLFGSGPCSGYIIQRAHGVEGRVVRHKVYRCYPYEDASTAGLAQTALDRLGVRAPVGAAPLFDDAFGTTSVGVAFAPERSRIEYATAYQCLLRGGVRSAGRRPVRTT